MSPVDAVAVATGCIGFVLGWISARITSDGEATRELLSAVNILNQVKESNEYR